MSEISLRNPITLLVNIVDWDSQLPSLETHIHIEVKSNSTSTITLELKNIWFFCTGWDQFTTLLLAGHQATLMDLDRSIELVVDPLEQGAELVISYRESYLADYDTSTVLTIRLDQDALAIFKEQFKDVPKWW